ncbi:hypothetical protein [Amycolatopsis solani]|uniref:hypothetical protein n=1 Tax=Amycolatopsis solani TaxID=3028615 RepID=UPI0025B16003|nr:hypothetical protein [Amycolatopsis sp. MEP2-6]
MDLPVNVLMPGERLLWSDRPRRIGLGGQEWFRLVFGIVWVSGVVVFAVPSGGGRHWYIGTVFAAFGAAAAFGPLIARQVTLRRSAYAVTDRRVVVVDSASGRTRASVYLSTLPPPVARAGADGTGTVTFGEAGGFSSVLNSSGQPPAAAKVELVGVPDAERVRDLIAQAQAAR